MEISYEIPNLINQKILEHVKIRTFFIYPPAKKIKKTSCTNDKINSYTALNIIVSQYCKLNSKMKIIINTNLSKKMKNYFYINFYMKRISVF